MPWGGACAIGSRPQCSAPSQLHAIAAIRRPSATASSAAPMQRHACPVCVAHSPIGSSRTAIGTAAGSPRTQTLPTSLSALPAQTGSLTVNRQSPRSPAASDPSCQRSMQTTAAAPARLALQRGNARPVAAAAAPLSTPAARRPGAGRRRAAAAVAAAAAGQFGVRLAGVGSSVPDKFLTNDDLAQLVDTNDEWITTRTGIKKRHILAEGESLGQHAAAASLRALEMAGASVCCCC